MDTLYQNGILERNKMHVIKNDDQFYFETVLISEGDFEVIPPQSSPTSGVNIFKSSDIYDLNDNEFCGSIIGESSDELMIPSIDLTNECQNKPNIIGKLATHESVVKLNGLNKQQGYFLANEKPPRATKAQTNCIYMNENKQNSSNSASLTLPSDNIIYKRSNSGFSSQISTDPISKKRKKALKLQRKKQCLLQNLNRIEEEICCMKKVSLNSVPSNFKVKQQMMSNVDNLSASKTSKSTQTITNTTEIIKSQKRGEHLNHTPNIYSNDRSENCNIDYLKECIIEASRTLIKTEKSLRVLSKLLHSDVLIEKKTAVKHLKEFRYTVNTFHKKMNGIDQKLLTHYRHYTPNFNTESVCEYDSTNHLNPQKPEDNIIDYESLLRRDKSFEVVIPAAASNRLKKY